MNTSHAEDRNVTIVKKQHALREFFFSLFVRGPVVLAIFLVVFITVLVIALILPPVYQSTAKFSMVMPRTFNPLEIQTAYDYKNMFRRQLQNQAELIMSNRVLLKVIDELKLGKLKTMARTLDDLREKVKVTPPKGETFEGTTYFYLTVQDSNPRRAAELALTTATAYQETFREMSQEKAAYSYAFFQDQTRELYQKTMEKEKVLRDYERDQALILIEILNLGSNSGSNMETGPTALLTQFTSKYNELREELAGIQATIMTIDKQTTGNRIPVVLPEMEVSGRAITVFKRKVAQLQIQLNEMKPRFEDRFALLQQVKQELNLNIDSLKKELARSVTAKKIQAKTIQARLAELNKVILELQQRIKVTAQEKSRYEQIKQGYELARNSYVSAMNQLEQARLSHAVDKEKQFITLVDTPVVASRPFKPNRIVLIVLGFFAGLFLAIATGLLFSFFDHSIRRHEDIDQYLGITILGSLPKL